MNINNPNRNRSITLAGPLTYLQLKGLLLIVQQFFVTNAKDTYKYILPIQLQDVTMQHFPMGTYYVSMGALFVFHVAAFSCLEDIQLEIGLLGYTTFSRDQNPSHSRTNDCNISQSQRRAPLQGQLIETRRKHAYYALRPQPELKSSLLPHAVVEKQRG